MLAKKLRIGNYVKSGKGIYKIYAMSIPQILAIQDYKEPSDSQKNVFSSDNTIIKPIKITVEWLEKFGFEKQNGVYIKKYCETNQIRVHIVNDKFSFYLDELCGIMGRYSVNLGFLDYVHELQNLYYGVAISELEPVK